MDSPLWKAAFYILTFATLGYMVWQFARRGRLWMKGKKVPWRSDWLANFLQYVIGQKKVQGSRPRSGAPMHLLMFWGFLALFVATTLLAVATYAPLARPSTSQRAN